MGYPVTGRRLSMMAMAFLVAALWLPPLANGAEPEPVQKAFIVSNYRYEAPEGVTVNPDIGLSLCGTRCNALSEDFANYLKPGGWRMVKITDKVENRVELNNPFMPGQCVCVGDEYKIEWYDPATYLDRS
jgi:hypothetical protein